MKLLPRADIREQWDAFCLSHPAAWAWHTNAWCNYAIAYKDGNTDLSFGALDGDRLVGICPLIQQGDEFSAGGDPLPWPLLQIGIGMVGMIVEHDITDRIDALAKTYGITRAAFRMSPLAGDTVGLFPWHVDGYKDISFSSRVVDLTQGIDDLHKGLRKSYQSEINQVLKTANVEQGGPEDIPVFLNRHTFCSGRQTRPTATWELMAYWLSTGQAFLAKVMRDGVPIGFAYFNLYKGSAYYSSGAYAEPNLAKAAIWRAMLMLKGQGITQLELGWQGHAADEKGKNIELFKRGFGGTDKPLYVVEKTWS